MTLFAVADFCLIPMGTPSPSVGIYIAECQRVLEKMKEEGIKYEMQCVFTSCDTIRIHYANHKQPLGLTAADMEQILKDLLTLSLVR